MSASVAVTEVMAVPTAAPAVTCKDGKVFVTGCGVQSEVKWHRYPQSDNIYGSLTLNRRNAKWKDCEVVIYKI